VSAGKEMPAARNLRDERRTKRAPLACAFKIRFPIYGTAKSHRRIVATRAGLMPDALSAHIQAVTPIDILGTTTAIDLSFFISARVWGADNGSETKKSESKI
jgi:hypothetical protein